jgi:hypothetical protein
VDSWCARGCLVDYARVGDSPFVVVVEQPYPWPIGLLLDRTLWGVVLTTANGGLAVLVWSQRRRWRRGHSVAAAGRETPPIS